VKESEKYLKWHNKYDRIWSLFDTDDIVIFGGHFNKKECLKIINFENYDEPSEYENHNIEHKFAKFGFVNFESKNVNGFLIKDESKTGRVMATILKKRTAFLPLIN